MCTVAVDEARRIWFEIDRGALYQYGGAVSAQSQALWCDDLGYVNDRCGCVRAHGYDLTGKMTGGGLHSVAWASATTLDSTSVIALTCHQFDHP